MSSGNATGSFFADATVFLFYGGWKADAFQMAMADFNDRTPHNTYTPDGDYDFLIQEQRVYIGQRMAKYIREGFR